MPDRATRTTGELCSSLADELSQHGIVLWAAHVVDQVALGGRWHCVDGCGAGGVVDDPSASPLAAAAVLDGRRLYPRRADLQAVIAVDDPARSAGLTAAVERTGGHPRGRASSGPRGHACCVAATSKTRWLRPRASRDGQSLSEVELAELGCALTDAASARHAVCPGGRRERR